MFECISDAEQWWEVGGDTIDSGVKEAPMIYSLTLTCYQHKDMLFTCSKHVADDSRPCLVFLEVVVALTWDQVRPSPTPPTPHSLFSLWPYNIPATSPTPTHHYKLASVIKTMATPVYGPEGVFTGEKSCLGRPTPPGVGGRREGGQSRAFLPTLEAVRRSKAMVY